MIGTAFVHTVIDDHSRVAYVEIGADETAQTAIGVLRRAVAWFAERGVHVERVLSDNGSCYKAYAWRDACTALGITPKRTRPYRPQTNGRSSDSTAPWPTAGPTPATTPQKTSAAKPSRTGSTSTITTESTPRSAARPSASSTTCLDITARQSARSIADLEFSGPRASRVEALLCRTPDSCWTQQSSRE